MYLIVGLGNPEEDYSMTRHNMGFDVINKIAKKYDINVSKTKFEALLGTGTIEENKVILLKPQTFMNLSGRSIKAVVDFYKIPLENMMVIFDDMDTEIGKVRMRPRGTGGSHNGAKSVINELNSMEFPRLRVGIGKPENKDDAIDYVISKLDDETYKELEVGIDKAVDAVISWLKIGIDNTMNKYNQ